MIVYIKKYEPSLNTDKYYVCIDKCLITHFNSVSVQLIHIKNQNIIDYILISKSAYITLKELLS